MLVIEMIDDVIKILPDKIKERLKRIRNINELTEIRLRTGKEIILYFKSIEMVLDINVVKEDLINILKNISSNSIYSVQNDLNKGYITIPGGHRIGIAGEVVVTGGVIKNIKDISSMNIRIAHELIGVADGVIGVIVKENKVLNTLIVSPPCFGKTTLLRDIIRNLSNMKYNVAVIDERGEIACMSAGYQGLDLGRRTDVISFVDKAYGFQMAVRSLNPDVVCTDEIGDEKDISGIEYLSRCGVSFILTMHGENIYDVKQGKMNILLEQGYIDNVIILGKSIGRIDKIYENLSKKEKALC